MTKPSVYEHLYTFTSPGKQRMVEHFDGDVLCPNRWDQNQIFSSTTFLMKDDIDQGVEIRSNNFATSDGTITAGNNERWLHPRGSVVLGVIRRATTNGIYRIGTGNRTNGDLGQTSDESYYIDNVSTQSCYRLGSVRGSCVTTTAMGTAIDLSWHTVKAEITSCVVKGTIDGGCVCACHSCDLPLCSSKLYPGVKTESLSTCFGETRVRYFEAFNT